MEPLNQDSATDGQTLSADHSGDAPGEQLTGDSDHGNDGNDNGDGDDRQPANNEDDEDDDDLMARLYGQDDDLDADESGHHESDLSGHDQDIALQENIVINTNNKSSFKRRSEELDDQVNKRIKAEPNDAPNETNIAIQQRLTTTIEVVEESSTGGVDIPKNSFEFMTFIMDLNANNLEGIETDLNRFSMSDNLQNISQLLTFKDSDQLREAFIPYILCDLWVKLKRIYNEKNHSYSNLANSKRLLSILTKLKTQKMRNGLEMKCVSIVRQKESPVFRFGQLITIQTAVQTKPNSSKHMFTRRKYFGYITSHVIRNTCTENQSEVNLCRLLNDNKRDPIYIEEFTFMTKFSEELYLRNDALLAAEPIYCIHNHHLEGRVVFKFNSFPLCRQVLNPVFNTRASGLSVSIKERKFDEDQVNMIQIALDVVASPHGSAFLAINGSKESEKTTVLSEIVRQIVICPHLKQKKVLFCSYDSSTLKNVEKYLKSRKIMTYVVDNGFNHSLKEFATKHVEHKLEKGSDERMKQLYEECINNLDTGCELSVESAVLKYSSVAEKSRFEAMKSCPVIMGRIDDLCNDIMFYKFFTSNQLFNCCIIDDSTLVSEPQFYSLFMFHIEKFIFGGDVSRAESDQMEPFRRFGCSRSFFERYYRLHKDFQNDQQNIDIQTTVFEM